jgi:alpha-ketoglutarate-dependent taurine dioxygenase/acyl carrier protein
MIPAAIVMLDVLPLTPNGKVDRKALPRPEGMRLLAGDAYVEPSGDLERAIAALWQQVLNVERVGAHDSFFDLGGHSLLATQLASRVRDVFGVELPLRSLLEKPTVAALAARLAAAQASGADDGRAPACVPFARGTDLPLSCAQQRLWFLDQLRPGNPIYNIPAALRLWGCLNVAALAQSFGEIVRRHEALRTTFHSVEGRPVQVVHAPAPVSLEVCDLRFLSDAERERVLWHLAAAEGQRPFKLSEGPLLRVRLLWLGEREHVLLLTAHHSIFDGWSIGLLIRELAALYTTFGVGAASSLAELPVQYADFAIWQRERLKERFMTEQLEYWKRQLAGLPELQLNDGEATRRAAAVSGETQSFLLPRADVDALEALCQREGATLFMTLLAVFYVLLLRRTGQTDIAVGTDIANRNRTELESLIGFFVNHLVLRTRLEGNPSFRELLARVREVVLAAYANQDLPFDKLVEELQPERVPERTPFFKVLFVLQNAPAAALELPHLALAQLDVAERTAKYELALILQPTERGLAAVWRYDASKFDGSAVRLMWQHYETLLRAVVAQPDARLNKLDMLSEAERRQQEKDKVESRESAIKQLRSARRKAISLSGDALVSSHELAGSHGLVLMVEPALPELDLADWAAHRRHLVNDWIAAHGAVLFRGFGVNSADAFERVAAAICPTLHAGYGDLPGESSSGRVYRSTPYPADQTILFHNESSHLPTWPLRQIFCCQVAARRGGQTPLADGRRVLRRLDPALARRLRERGLLYVRNFGGGLDVDWPQFFGTADPARVEQLCAQWGMTCEWKPDGGLRTRQRRPAVAQHPATGAEIFFNQLQAHHISCVEARAREALLALFAPAELPRNVYYGDGGELSAAEVDEVRAVYEAVAVEFDWQAGDVLAVDNMLAAHARRPYEGERKVLVAMGEMFSDRMPHAVAVERDAVALEV